MRRQSLSTLGLAALALVLLGSSGCKDFKYFDVHVAFNPAQFDVVSVGSLNHCSITVSGADSFEGFLPGCPNPDTKSPDRLNAGTFEFSSFADAGNMTFTVKAWLSNNENAPCQLGQGATTIQVKGDMTLNGTLLIDKTGDGTGCTN